MEHQIMVKRLALIRYLYMIGIELSYRPEPLNAPALLTFHDSIELFLQLAIEKKGVNKNDVGFMDYWDIISSKLNGSELTQKESMRRLNKARVSFKHHGTLPSKLDMEAFRASTTSFFNENSKIIFGLEFSDISLIEVIQNEKVRDRLKQGVSHLDNGQIVEALDHIAVSFTMLIDEYESSKINDYGRSPFYFGKSLDFLSSFFIGIGRGGSSQTERKLAQYIDGVKESVESLQKAVKMLSLGIDYRKYSKFILLTPYVSRVASRDYVIDRRDWGEKGIPSSGDVKLCIDFIIESAIKLQEFDYII